MINLKNVGFKRGDFRLEASNIGIKEGEKVALLGENGSGKSTLIHLMCGFLKGADIEYNSEPLKKIPFEKRAHLFSFLPQLPELAFPFSVFDVVHFATYPYGGVKSGERLERTIKTIDSFGLTHLKERGFEQLSGGEKRRVMLARAVNQDTPVIYLDEPVSMLDVRHSLEILEYIKNTNKTVVASMHDINLSLEYFDRFIFLKKGQVLGNCVREEIDESLLEKVYGVGVGTSGDGYTFWLQRRSQ